MVLTIRVANVLPGRRCDTARKLEPVSIALLLVVVAGVVWHANGRRGQPVLAGAWVLYAGYELLMFLRVLCPDECNIRIDLLVPYPVLLGASIWGGIAYGWGVLRRRRGSSRLG